VLPFFIFLIFILGGFDLDLLHRPYAITPVKEA
jgi:hypothetical protein